jgi:ribosomal protein S18 acetylase RimI-like enzyme
MERRKMHLSVHPLSEYDPTDIVEIFNRAFSGYLIEIDLEISSLLAMLRYDNVDWDSSRIVRRGKEEVGVALMASRGWNCRLAGMAIVPEARGKGIGSWLMGRLVEEAKKRGERTMVLEVIEQNDPAVSLYRNRGFRVFRRLLGFESHPRTRKTEIELREVDIREIARVVTAHGLYNLPWQISGESIAQLGPPCLGFREGDACILISDPERNPTMIRSLIVEPGMRGQGQGSRLLRTTMSKYDGVSWKIPILCPEELEPFFVKSGFSRESMTQLQMVLDLV